MISVTPDGLITVVSKLWGGNSSDRFITKSCGYLDKIEKGDLVMADKGFNIRNLLLLKQATLVIPPFTRKCSWGKGKTPLVGL